MLTTIFTLLIFIPSAFSQTLPRPLQKNRVQALMSLDYFSSTANYGAAGSTYKSLPDNGNFQNVLVNMGGAYDVDNKWKLLGGLTASMVNAQNDNYTHSSSEVSELNLGAHYWFMKRPFWLIPVVKFTYPLQRVSDSTTGTITGEGAMTFEGGAWVAKKFRSVRAHAYLGLKYQDENRANLIPWTLAAEYRPQFWYFSGGLRGYETLQGSGDSREAHEAVVERTNAGSLRYYSVNPNSREIWGESGLHWQNWQVWLGVGQTFNGRSSAAGFTATIGGLLNFNFGDFNDDDDSGSPYEPDVPVDNFESGTEKYDHSLFEESTPAAPADEMAIPGESVEDAPVKKKVLKKKPAKKVKKIKKGPSTEQMLDETQKQLEGM